MTTPLVTVAVSAYNAGRYLRPSVESVLAQTYENLEVVVVDDGSTDGSVQTIESLDDSRLRIVRQDNQGKSVALNRILDETSSEYVMVHDADDISYPNRAATQVAAMEANPKLGACFTQFELLIGDKPLAPRTRGLNEGACARLIEAFKQPAIDPTLMFRRSAATGERFDPDLRVGQCVDFILRLGEQHPMIVIGECAYGYRIHPESNTRHDAERTLRYQAEVRRKAMERRGLVETPRETAVSPGTSHVVVAHCVEAVLDARVEHDRRTAVRIGLACSRIHPAQTVYHKPLVYALMPKIALRRVRGDRFA